MGISPGWFGARGRMGAAAREARSRIMREALQPDWYETYGAFDTFEGRAGMVTLIMSLACDRLAVIGNAGAARLAGRISALVVDGFDAAFRELGVGDHSIARKVRALAQTHSGMGRAMLPALSARGEENEDPVTPILVRNGVVSMDRAGLMTARVRFVQEGLHRQPVDDILAGVFVFRLAAGDD